MSHQLVHGGAQVGGSVPHGLGATSPLHGWQVVRAEKDLEEAFKRLAGNEGVEATIVQAEGAENVWEGPQHLSGGRDIFD